jgi:YHS domain-containing protein
MLRFCLVVALGTAACGGSKAAAPSAPTAPASKVLVLVDAEGVGLGGHDPVAYATDNAAIAGTAEQSSQHGGAMYRFASAEHKAAFDAEPAKHAPRYGGYCAFAASQNRLSQSDPKVFQIVDGQLLVFTNESFKEQFNKDVAGNKAKADANWPGLVAKHGK